MNHICDMSGGGHHLLHIYDILTSGSHIYDIMTSGGGHHLVRADEDLGVEADRGRDPGGARPEEHLRPRHAPQHKVQLRGGLQEVLGLRHRAPQVRE